jgi:hypothetical protein
MAVYTMVWAIAKGIGTGVIILHGRRHFYKTILTGVSTKAVGFDTDNNAVSLNEAFLKLQVAVCYCYFFVALSQYI